MTAGGVGGGRVAVLGGTGLLGAAIARAFLDARWSVAVLARHAPEERTAALLDGAELRLGDANAPLDLRDAIAGADHVVDVLGVPHPSAPLHGSVAQFDVELPAILGVLEALRTSVGTALTYVSSGGAVYGNPTHLPVGEDAPCRPISPYGVTKLAAERYVQLAARRDGLKARILRVANAYGDRQRPRTGQGLVAALLDAAATATPVELFGDGSALRDYVDVRDVATATVALAKRADGEVVCNVGTGHGHRVDDVVALAESVTGVALEVRRRPARPTDVTSVVLDVGRLASLVEWRPRPLEQGIAEAWASWSRDGTTAARSSS